MRSLLVSEGIRNMRTWGSDLKHRLGWLALILAMAGAGPALADRHDHDLARQALEAGQILPLRNILDIVETRYPGQVLEVEFDHDDGAFIYEIKVLQPQGKLVKLELDARNGEVVRAHDKLYDD